MRPHAPHPRAAGFPPGVRPGWGALGHSPSGVVKVNKEPIITKFGEHLIMVTVHISCRGGKTLRPTGQVAGAPDLCVPS